MARRSPTGAVVSTRDSILQHSAHLFAERSYAATSIDDVGQAVGVSGPAIYWHFRGKEDLLREMLTDVSDRLLAGAQVRVTAAADDRTALEVLVAFQVEFALANPDLIVIHGRELVHLPAEDRRTVRRAQRLYIEEWVAVLQRLYPDRDRTVIVASVQAVIGLINATPYLHLDQDQAAAAHLLRVMALAALRADPALPAAETATPHTP